MNSATLNWITPNADETIAYLARQSSPKNQARTIELQNLISTGTPEESLEASRELKSLTRGLIKFCSSNGHWSVFEQACMSVTIETTRAIAPQILRHHSFRFQEFSQRYAVVEKPIEMPELRFVDGAKRNPSTSHGFLSDVLKERLKDYLESSKGLYDELVSAGVHPESARFYLPLAAPTTLSMTANIRDWIFYIKNRTSPHAQKEHQAIAFDVADIFSREMPITYGAINELLMEED